MMQIINNTACTEEAIAVLRKLADSLESREVFLHRGEISDTKRHGEQRTIGLDITVVTSQEFEI